MSRARRAAEVETRRKKRARSRLAAAILAAVAITAAAVWLIARRGGQGGGGEDSSVPPLVPVESMEWPSVPEDARPYLARGVEELRRAAAIGLDTPGALQEAGSALAAAMDLLSKAGALTPEVGAYHYRLVLGAVDANRLPEAEQRASWWVESHPGDHHHLFLLGQVRYHLGRWAPALESMRRAAAARPRSWEAWWWLAEICFRLGAREEGVEATGKALELVGYPGGAYRSHPGGQKVLGNAVKVLHRFQEYGLLARVARDYRTGFPGLTEDAIVECAMAEGIALAELGRYAEAEPLLRRARSGSENADEVAFQLGVALFKEGKLEEARLTLAELLALSPHFGRAYYQLGLVLSRLGKEKEAGAMFGKSRELAPSDRETRRDIELKGAGQPGRAAAAAARARVLRGQLAEAEALLRARELKDDPYAVFALADFYLDSLRALDAEKVLLYAAALVGEDHPDVRGRRGLALHMKGEEARAFELLRAAAGSNAQIWGLRLGRLLVESGRQGEALPVLEPLRRSEADREASFLLGRALLERGEPGRALEMLRSVSAADTRWPEWEGDAFLAWALAAAGGPPPDTARAAELLDAAPPRSRSSPVWLRARIALLEREGKGPEELDPPRRSLARHDELEPSAKALRRRIASTPWPASGPLHLELARLEASRGRIDPALREARLCLQADPRSLEALRALAEWLRGDGEVFDRLRALRNIIRLAPGDAAAIEEARRIEAAWLAKASA